jgi:hypothetical protein
MNRHGKVGLLKKEHLYQSPIGLMRLPLWDRRSNSAPVSPMSAFLQGGHSFPASPPRSALRDASLDNQRIKGKPGHGGVPGSPEQRYRLVGTGTAISLYIMAPEKLLTLLSNCDVECQLRSNSLMSVLCRTLVSQRKSPAEGKLPSLPFLGAPRVSGSQSRIFTYAVLKTSLF